MLAPILSGSTDVVYGVRDLSDQRLTTRWGNRFLTVLTNLLYGTRLHDMETCYKVMRTSIADPAGVSSATALTSNQRSRPKSRGWGTRLLRCRSRTRPAQRKSSPPGATAGPH